MKLIPAPKIIDISEQNNKQFQKDSSQLTIIWNDGTYLKCKSENCEFPNE